MNSYISVGHTIIRAPPASPRKIKSPVMQFLAVSVAQYPHFSPSQCNTVTKDQYFMSSEKCYLNISGQLMRNIPYIVFLSLYSFHCFHPDFLLPGITTTNSLFAANRILLINYSAIFA